MRNVIAVLLTLGIPLCLFLGVWQSSRCIRIEKAIQDYDKEQYRLIEENKRNSTILAAIKQYIRHNAANLIEGFLSQMEVFL